MMIKKLILLLSAGSITSVTVDTVCMNPKNIEYVMYVPPGVRPLAPILPRPVQTAPSVTHHNQAMAHYKLSSTSACPTPQLHSAIAPASCLKELIRRGLPLSGKYSSVRHLIIYEDDPNTQLSYIDLARLISPINDLSEFSYLSQAEFKKLFEQTKSAENPKAALFEVVKLYVEKQKNILKKKSESLNEKSPL